MQLYRKYFFRVINLLLTIGIQHVGTLQGQTQDICVSVGRSEVNIRLWRYLIASTAIGLRKHRIPSDLRS